MSQFNESYCNIYMFMFILSSNKAIHNETK